MTKRAIHTNNIITDIQSLEQLCVFGLVIISIIIVVLLLIGETCFGMI